MRNSSWSSWLKGKSSKTGDRRYRSSRRRFSHELYLEPLEQRVVPSIAKVQELGVASGTGFVSISLPFTRVKIGDAIIVELAEAGNLDPAFTVTDSAGNTFDKDADINGSGPSHNLGTQIFSATDVKAFPGSGTITIQDANDVMDFMVASAAEFSGVAFISPRDQTSSNQGNREALSSGTTATTAQADELVIGNLGVGDSPNNEITVGSGFTALVGGSAALTSAPDSPFISIQPEFQIVTATSQYAANGSLLSSANWSAAVVTYKAAAVTAPATHFSVVPSSPTVPGETPFNLTVTAARCLEQPNVRLRGHGAFHEHGWGRTANGLRIHRH